MDSIFEIFIENHQHELGQVHIFEEILIVQSEVFQNSNIDDLGIGESFHQRKQEIDESWLHVEVLRKVLSENFFQNEFLILKVQMIKKFIDDDDSYFPGLVVLQTLV